MHWIAATLLMFVSSCCLYLIIRKALLSGLSTQYSNLAGFAIPMVAFALGSFVTGTSFAMTFKQAGILLVAGVLFAYLSNRASLMSIAVAPNPGYSLVISKSYVVLTTFLAVPLLGSHLSWTALAAVLCIVGFSALIMLGPKAGRAKSSAWLPLALVAFFGWAFLSLAAKYLFAEGMATLTFLTCLYVIVTVCIAVEMHIKRIGYRQIAEHWQLFALIGLASTGFNFFNFYAIGLAPNVGYVNATNAASIAVVTLFAAWLFKDDLTLRKVIGVFGVIAGLLLLFLG